MKDSGFKWIQEAINAKWHRSIGIIFMKMCKTLDI